MRLELLLGKDSRLAQLPVPLKLTVRHWIDAGTLPAVRIGQRRVRIKRSDLDRFIETGAPDGRRA